MNKLKVFIILCVILFLVCITLSLVLIGSGRQKSGHKIYRNNEMLLVFLPMKHTSKIVDATLDNNELIVNIDNGEKIVRGVTSLKHRVADQLIRSDETLEVAGTDRINHYGVVHLSVYSPRPTHLRNSMTNVQEGFSIRKFAEKPGPFSNSGTYRIGESITAYSYLPYRFGSSWKNSISGIEIKIENSTTSVDEDSDVTGYRVIQITTKKITTGKFGVSKENVSFLLKGIKPHETVEIGDKHKIGDDLYLVDLKVVPKNKQGIKTIQLNPPSMNRPTPPMNRPNLRDR